MSNVETILSRSVVLFILAALLFSARAIASDDLNQYGLGSDGSTIPVEKRSLEKLPNFLINVEYEDTEAGFSSPFHGYHSALNNRLNNTSNEYQTRMGYQFDHLTSEAVFNYSPDSYGFGKYYNYELGVSVPIKDIFSLETSYGWNKFDKQTSQGGVNDYQDWRVGVSTTYKGMKLKVDYIDMNASENSLECGKSLSCEGKTVFSIIKNF